jgi:hypothetical protein
MEYCGLTPDPENLPRRQEEYYWMLLIGEAPPEDRRLLPRRPLSFYLAALAGVDHDPSLDLEAYWCFLTEGFIPNPLPRNPLEYYLMNYTPSGFRFRIDLQGDGLLYGEAPLPNFTLEESTGVLVYTDDVPGSPPVSAVSLNPVGQVILEA